MKPSTKRFLHKTRLIQIALLGLLLFLGSAAIAKTVTLNLKGADINSLITTVSEVTGKNFIVDPRVKGKVTIVSSEPLNEKSIYQVFLAVLDVHGFTAVPSGDVIKILPDADAKHTGTPAQGKGQEVVTQVVAIKHIAAAQLVPILRPLVPPQGHLAAHAQTNTLIVADRASNIGRLMRIIAKVDEPSGSEIEVINLEHASAAEVVRILTTLRQQGKKKNPQSTTPTLVADERTNSILVGGEKNARLQIKTIIAHLDTPSDTVGNTHVIYLRYAKAPELVKVLTGVGKVKAQSAQKGAKRRTSRSQDFDIQADEAANALVITAPPDVFRSLETVVRKLDVRRAQVLVEAIIAEVSSSKTSELGIQWFAGSESPGERPIGVTNFGSNSIVNVATAARAAKEGAATALPIGNGLTVGVGSITSGKYSFGALINALAGDGSANLLSTPNIVTMDNEEAEIFVGKEVSIPSGSFSSTNTGNVTNPFTTFKSKQVGIRLKVKPQINEGDAIKLEIDQAVDAITSGDAGAANLVTSQRTIKTSVMVDDGQIVVLGGLITDDQNKTEQKVPLLGDIPLLGALFRYKRDTNDKTNLMVFLRPEILRDAATTAAISSGKYNFIRGKQLVPEDESDIFGRRPPPALPQLEEYLKPRDKGKDQQSSVAPDKFAPQSQRAGKAKVEEESYVADILNDEF